MFGCAIVKSMLLTAISDQVLLGQETKSGLCSMLSIKSIRAQPTCYVRNAMAQCNDKYVYYI